MAGENQDTLGAALSLMVQQQVLDDWLGISEYLDKLEVPSEFNTDTFLGTRTTLLDRVKYAVEKRDD